jgi:hypothetical protein
MCFDNVHIYMYIIKTYEYLNLIIYIFIYIDIYTYTGGYAVAQLVEALRYKPDVRDSRWCRNFSLT